MPWTKKTWLDIRTKSEFWQPNSLHIHIWSDFATIHQSWFGQTPNLLVTTVLTFHAVHPCSLNTNGALLSFHLLLTYLASHLLICSFTWLSQGNSVSTSMPTTSSKSFSQWVHDRTESQAEIIKIRRRFSTLYLTFRCEFNFSSF